MSSCSLAQPAKIDFQHRTCPACGADNPQAPSLANSVGDWRLKRCGECEQIYLENPPPTTALVDEYNWTATFQQEAERRSAARPILNRISHAWKHWRGRWLPRKKLDRLVRRYVPVGNLLDVGCGTGAYFDRLSSEIVPFGIEIDTEAIAEARSRVEHRGGRIIHSDAIGGLEQLEARSMNGIVMHSFLEHEVAPLELLSATRRVLADEGVCIIKVPNFDCWNRRYLRPNDWPGFRFPDHVNYFTPATLRGMAEQAGLRVVRFSWVDRLPTSDNMWLIAGRA